MEALVEMKIRNDPALEYSTYQDIALKDLQRRANEQMEVYQSASGVFTMGKWLAEYLIQTGKLPREKVHAVGGGTNIDASKVDDSQKKGNKFLFVGAILSEKAVIWFAKRLICCKRMIFRKLSYMLQAQKISLQSVP